MGCHKIGLGIIRALGSVNIPVIGVSYGNMDMGVASKFLYEVYRLPNPDEAPEEFISQLELLGNHGQKRVLIPSDDAALLCVAKHYDYLCDRFKIAACRWDIIKKCIEKKLTYEVAAEAGVPCPHTMVPKSVEEVHSFADQFKFPCLLKPSIGHSFYARYKKKMLFIQNRNALIKAYEQLSKAGIEIMLQEYIPGDDCNGVNYNSFFHQGKIVIAITAQKVRLSPPRIGFPRVIISKFIPELQSPAIKLLKAFNFDGFSCMEFKKDSRDGIYKLMEINARLNFSSPLSVKAGVNFPYLVYKYALCGIVPDKISEFKEGVYWIDPGKDLIECIKNFKNERFPIKEYITPYLKPHIFTIHSMDDYRPVMKRCTDLSMEIPKRLLSKLVSKKRCRRSLA